MLINMSQDNLNELNEDLIKLRTFIRALHDGTYISMFGKSMTDEGTAQIDYFEERLSRWL